ncbi:lipoprotein [Kibdelosporangium persicum]|nr:lipoprotein [Kibdelosporangium persicum]
MIRLWGTALLTAALLAGCDSTETKPDPEVSAGDGSIGADGSACPLPVTFDLPKGWQAEAVPGDDFRMGEVTLACEIDAKPAGMIGFIRVFTGETKGTAESALKAFVQDYKGKGEGDAQEAYTAIKVGGVDGVEVEYVNRPTSGTSKRERAFALRPGTTAVVVHLGGIDDAEHDSMLSSYQLVRKTVALR